MSITALYPGTFDPITNGHTDVIERASGLFDHVVVAVADNQNTTKQTRFTTEERVSLAEIVLADMSNVKVCSFAKLVVDKAQEIDAQVIIRGLRAVSDFDYEFQMAGMNRRLYKEAETVFLTPAEHLTFLSSSLVRQISSLGGDVNQFVHPEVAKALTKTG
mgnify:CR=1 FL=1